MQSYNQAIMQQYLIIGQGLAGTLLAYFLKKAGQTVHIVDNSHHQASSKVAAGIINPITGRRFVKSWRIDELLPFARQTYQQIEQELENSLGHPISIFHKKPILRILFSQKEENDWLGRAALDNYAPYMSDKMDWGEYENKVTEGFSLGELCQTAQVDIKTLIKTFQTQFLKEGILKLEKLDYNELDIQENGVIFQDDFYHKVIFCEGYGAIRNPFFNYLPFNAAKGDVLLIRIPHAKFQRMLKHRVFIVPLGGDLYWVGSNYIWTFEDDSPTAEGYDYLLGRLKEVLKVPFEVVEHLAAIRPTVKGRRPFLGIHPKFSALAIFNGMGTKGASLSPWFANKMVSYLLKNKKLDSEVNIKRFWKED